MGGYPSFPALPSGANPYVGAAADFASSASHLAASLREAAIQQQQLQQSGQQHQAAQAHQGLMDQLDALSKGAIPVAGPSDEGNDPGYVTKDPGAAPGTPGNVMPVLRGAQNHVPLGYDRPGLEDQLAQQQAAAPQSSGQVSGTAAPAAPAQKTATAPSRDPSRMQQIGGKWFYIPTDAEREKAKQVPQDNTNSFPLSKTTSDAMNEYYGDGTFKEGQRLPLAHASLATEAVKAHLSKNALNETNSLTVTEEASKRLKAQGINIDVGARIPIEHAANAIDLVKIAFPAPAKPDASQIIPGMVGPGGGPLLLDKNKASASEVPLPAGSKQQLTAGQQEVKQRAQQHEEDRQDTKDRALTAQQQKAEEIAQKRLDILQTKEQEQHALRQNYGRALATEDGEQNINPDTGRSFTMDTKGKYRGYFQDKYDKATALAQSYADQQKKIIARHGGGGDQPAADAPKSAKAAPAAGAKPATNGQQTGNKQAVTLQHVRNYAKAKGVSEAQAIKEFKQYGYPIGQ